LIIQPIQSLSGPFKLFGNLSIRRVLIKGQCDRLSEGKIALSENFKTSTD